MSSDMEPLLEPITTESIAELLERHFDELSKSFRAIHERLDVLERKLSFIPDLNFLHQSELAQRCLEAIKKAETKPTLDVAVVQARLAAREEAPFFRTLPFATRTA